MSSPGFISSGLTNTSASRPSGFAATSRASVYRRGGSGRGGGRRGAGAGGGRAGVRGVRRGGGGGRGDVGAGGAGVGRQAVPRVDDELMPRRPGRIAQRGGEVAGVAADPPVAPAGLRAEHLQADAHGASPRP